MSSEILRMGREVLDRELEALRAVQDRLDENFVRAVRLILDTRGRVVVTGIGKAGQIGLKIQSTLSSTGSPAYFLHPAEALHGDLGMVDAHDAVIALTNSGQTQELVALIPLLKANGCPVILITGRTRSRCARMADVVLDIGDTPEACPLGMAPSSSTTAMLALGDALALTVMRLKNIQPEQYATLHPGGALGRSLMRVSQLMRTGKDCPTLSVDGVLEDYYAAVTQAPSRAGAAAVVDADGKLVGIFTHGDLFRLNRNGAAIPGRPVREIMTASPKHTRSDSLVAEAIHIMQAGRLDELPVVDAQGLLVGILDVQDLIQSGFSVFDDN